MYLGFNSEEICKRILCSIGMELPDFSYCPLVVPIINLLLLFLKEEEAYFLIYELLNDNIKYRVETHIYTTKKDEQLMYKVFSKVFRKQFPKLYEVMESLGATIDDFVDDWFQNFFMNSLPITTVIQIFTVYLNEGTRILYRAGLGILNLFYADLINCKTKINFLNMIHQLSIQLISTEFLKVSYSFSLIDLQKSRNTLINEILDVVEPNSIYYRPKIENSSSIFQDEMWELIYEWLPKRCQIKDPVSIFRVEEYGYNLRIFYEILADNCPSLLVLKAPNDSVFGVFMSIPWNVSTEIVGHKDTFLFTIKPTCQKFEWKQEKDNAIQIENKGFYIGMGPDGFGLSIDDDWNATSSPCPTFNNPPLAGNDYLNTSFSIMAIEAYIFV